MKRQVIFLIISILFHSLDELNAQADSLAANFPDGSPILKVYANLNYGLTQADPSRAFEIQRAYIGYKCRLDPYFSTELKLDIGSPDQISEFARLRRYAYFKNVALYWTKNKWTLKGGIIDTEHFKLQEKIWKHRYLYKSLQDEHGFGPSADLGITVIFRPFEHLVLDASLLNGEGYSNLQQDDAFKGSFGITYAPAPALLLRVYCDVIHEAVIQSTFSSFVAYQNRKLTAGAEYNRKDNAGFLEDHQQTGISSYLSYDIGERFEIFGRYDVLSSNEPPEYSKPWNLHEDGSALIAGIQFRPISQVRLALDYQDWVPRAANMDNRVYLFLNLGIAL